MDRTPIEAWAKLAEGSTKRSLVEWPVEGSQKSFRPKDGSDPDGRNFRRQTRKNETHASTTDPGSRLYRKAAGREAKLCYMGHVTMENRHGLAVAGKVTQANGTAERRSAEAMLRALKKRLKRRRITVGEDKAYDTTDHVTALRDLAVTPHVARNDAETKTGKRRRSAIDGRTTRHRGYQMSQTRRAMIECIFGWGKQHGTMRKTKHRDTARLPPKSTCPSPRLRKRPARFTQS